jgi:hypothetical protein
VCVNGDRLLTAHALHVGWRIERFQRLSSRPSAAALRHIRRRVASMSAPAVRRAHGHVRNTARSLREL